MSTARVRLSFLLLSSVLASSKVFALLGLQPLRQRRQEKRLPEDEGLPKFVILFQSHDFFAAPGRCGDGVTAFSARFSLKQL